MNGWRHLTRRVNTSQPVARLERPSFAVFLCFSQDYLSHPSCPSGYFAVTQSPDFASPFPFWPRCCRPTHAEVWVHAAKWEVSDVIAWLRLPVPSQCQPVSWHKMRAGCHGELSETCSGSLLHLAVAPNDEQGEHGWFAVQQRGHISCRIATHSLYYSTLLSAGQPVYWKNIRCIQLDY